MISSALQALQQLAHVSPAAPVQEALAERAWGLLGVTNLREAMELAVAAIVVAGVLVSFKKDLAPAMARFFGGLSRIIQDSAPSSVCSRVETYRPAILT